MTGSELLWVVFEWLPRVFLLDLVVFHLVADHPLSVRWWWRRGAPARRRGAGAAAL